MKDIKEIAPSTSPYEILVHLFEKILSRELLTFEALKSYASVLPDGPRTSLILKKAFELQRQLYWGFFRDVTPDTFPRVWNAVVLPDPRFPFAGDLKRYMSIPDIYAGLLDIRGYTRYCRENRHNLSMLDLLDRMIQEDIPEIAAREGVVSRRSQGDTILLLGASAEDVLKAALQIIDYFARRRRSADEVKPAGRPGSGVVLPEFLVSAGLAGGQKYTPLVITRDGDLSGDIINSAARLQARAGKVSPDRNKVLVTSHVFQRIQAGGVKGDRGLLSKVDFFNTGTIDFKGTSLSVYDTVFLSTEAYRLSYRDLMEELYDSMDKSMWKSKVFLDTLRVAARLADNLPGIVLKTRQGVDAPEISRQSLLDRVKAAQDYFSAENYELAVTVLGSLVEDFSQLEGMDDLALEYIRAIHENYSALAAAFVENLDREVDEHMDQIFSPKETESFTALRSNHRTYEKSLTGARLRVRNRKAVWYRIADSWAPELGIRIQSQK